MGKRERKFPMKKLRMPATNRTILQNIAFTFLCCALLMVFTATAQTNHPMKTGASDPPNEGPPTGAILDLNGTPIPGGGNGTYQQYTVSFNASLTSTAITFAFRDDPAYISFASASVTDNATPSLNLLFNGDFSKGVYTDNGNSSTPDGWTYANMYGASFGGVVEAGSPCPGGPSDCWYDGATQAYDAISQTIPTTPGHTYTISFSVAENSDCIIFPNETEIQNSPCNFSDISTDGDGSDTGGNGIDVTVYAEAGLPPAQYTLTLTGLGGGAGTVTDSNGGTCQEANGAVTATGDFTVTSPGTCSANYESGTQVTLMATANGSSTFGGWGGACSGTSTCALSMTSSQNVTATFVAPPVTSSVIPSTCSGTNVTGTVNYCPNNPNPISPQNPCTDPNGVQFSISIPVVSQPTQGEQCLALSVTATEVQGHGLCPAGGNGQSSDFDCRLVNFYNYGTDPATGSTVTPLCYPFSNGDCMFYSLTLTGGGVPNPELYSGGVYWELAFNRVATPGSYWLGSTPSMLDDPGEDEISPLPWGTDCSTKMMTDNTSLYPGPYYCQFDNNITTFYTPGGGSFDPVGGRSNQANDVVVAFLPTSVPSGSSTPAPVLVAPTAIAVACVGTPAGCTASGDPSITFTEGTGGTAAVTSIGQGSVPPYPAATMTAATTSAPVTASESGNLVTLSSTGFGSQAVSPNTVVVNNCTPAGYNGTFPIVSGTGTMLTYTDSTTGLGAGTGCQALVLPNGLTFNAAAGILSGTPADGTAGNYPIIFTATNSQGFVILSDTLTVSPAGTLTITASNASMTYGGTVPTITPSYMGFVNGDTAANLTTQPTCATTATSSSPVIASPYYPSTCSGAVDANYSKINYVPGTVTVNPATLTITASGTMTYGGTMLTITPSYMGFVNGDTPASLTAPPNCTTTATSASPVGSYPITCSGAVDANYTISYMGGTLMVNPAPLTITANNQSKNYGVALTLGTTAFTTSTLYNGNTVTGVTLTSAGAAAGAAAGTYPIVPSSAVGNGLGNYSISYVNGTLTVGGLEITALNSFGTVYLNGLGVEFINLTNPGPSSLTISSLAIGSPGNALPDYRDYAVTLCPPMIEGLPASIPAGKTCTIAVTIHPTVNIFSPIASTATLIINESAGGSQAFPLTAQVIDPLVSLSSTSLSFGNQETGTTSTPKEVTLTNSGQTSLQLTGLSINGNFAFASGTTCSNSTMLSPGGTCLIYVSFKPTTRGSKSGSVTITDLTLKGKQSITLSGTGS